MAFKYLYVNGCVGAGVYIFSIVYCFINLVKVFAATEAAKYQMQPNDYFFIFFRFCTSNKSVKWNTALEIIFVRPKHKKKFPCEK